jgi:hypothetical protein
MLGSVTLCVIRFVVFAVTVTLDGNIKMAVKGRKEESYGVAEKVRTLEKYLGSKSSVTLL